MTLKSESSKNIYGETASVSETTVWARFTNSFIEVHDEGVDTVYHDKEVWLEPDADPNNADKISFDGKDYEITYVKPVLDKNNEVYQWRLAVR